MGDAAGARRRRPGLTEREIGDFIEIQPEVIRKTQTLVFLRGMLMVGDRVVSSANGVWKILDRPQPQPQDR